MDYKIEKVRTNYVLKAPTYEKTLMLVTSVAFYSGSLIYSYLRWKVLEDTLFLKQLIYEAELNPSEETFKPLVQMEDFYLELRDEINPETTSPERAKELRKDKYAARYDLSNTEMMSMSEVEVEGISTLAYGARTIGSLAEEKSRADGINRTKHKLKKKKSSE